MLEINQSNTKTRKFFNTKFFRFNIKITVLENSYLFIGSGKDEIIDIKNSNFTENLPLSNKIERIAAQIRPMSSSMVVGGKPIIPGSTLKGMIRFFLEHSFKPSNNNNNRINSCFIKQARPKRTKDVRNFLRIFGYFPSAVPERGRNRDSCNENRACKVCDLFGTSSLASRVIISDAVAIDAHFEEVDLSAKWREEKRVIAPESQFTFSVNINNGDIEDLVLLYIGMNLHNGGYHLLGLNKYRSRKNRRGIIFLFGKIKMEIIEIQEYYNDEGEIKEQSYIEPTEINNFNREVFQRIKQSANLFRNIKLERG